MRPLEVFDKPSGIFDIPKIEVELVGPNATSIAGQFDLPTSFRPEPLFPSMQYLATNALRTESFLHAECGNSPHHFLPVHDVETMKRDESHHMSFHFSYQYPVVRIVMVMEIALCVLQGNLRISQLLKELLNGRRIGGCGCPNNHISKLRGPAAQILQILSELGQDTPVILKIWRAPVPDQSPKLL